MSGSVAINPELTVSPSQESPWAGRVLLFVLIVVNIPLFLAMPLTNDTMIYDLQARNVLNGGIQYGNLFETNLPGVVWIHMLVRGTLGWRSEVLRAFDLLVFAGSTWLLTGWVRRLGKSERVSTWVAFTLFWVWFSVSEWCHCQRDSWMLLPALMGLGLRARQIQRLTGNETSSWATLVWALLEGVCWGAAFWIKPFIIVPALAAWLASTIIIRKLRPVLVDLCGLLVGGILIGAVGIIWMMTNGAWPYFLDTFLNWNPEYVRSGKKHWTFLRFLGMFYRLFPWLQLHLLAVPLALFFFIRGIATSFRAAASDDASTGEVNRRTLLAAFYLGWVCQSFLLQHLFDYVHIPAILLAVVVIATCPRGTLTIPAWKPLFACFLITAVVASPVMRSDRVSTWMAAVKQGSTPATRQKLAHQRIPSWDDLDRVKGFLQNKNIQPGELTCLNGSLVALYDSLEMNPSTRFIYLQEIMIFFPSHRKEIYQALADSRQKYIVTDLSNSGFPVDAALELSPKGPTLPPPGYSGNYAGTYPWSHPVVYRAGPYLVHQVTEPLGRFRPFVPDPPTSTIAGDAENPVTASTDVE